MQSVGSTLRRAGTSTSILRLSCATNPTRAVLWNFHRNASLGDTFNWMRSKLGPRIREEPTAKELAVARKEQAESGQGSVFESLVPTKEDKAASSAAQTIRWVDDTELKPRNSDLQHKYSTANFKMSHKKLNKLGRQISGKPIDSAILQMMFSEKRASKRVKSMLAVARKHAIEKGLQEKRLIVSEAWVTKGPNFVKRIEPRGRGHHGVRTHPHSRLSVILREGKTVAEVKEEVRLKKLKRVVSAGLIREDVPLRNPGPAWAW